MKKIIFLVVLLLAVASYFGFKDKIMMAISAGKDKTIEMAVEKAAEQNNLSPEAKAEIIKFAKSVDTEIVIEFMKDPNGFVAGNSEKASAFMNSPDGAKAKEIAEKFLKQ